MLSQYTLFRENVGCDETEHRIDRKRHLGVAHPVSRKRYSTPKQRLPRIVLSEPGLYEKNGSFLRGLRYTPYDLTECWRRNITTIVIGRECGMEFKA